MFMFPSAGLEELLESTTAKDDVGGSFRGDIEDRSVLSICEAALR